MQSWAIGVDLGGTKIEVAMVTPEGQLLDRLRIPTPHNHHPADVTKDIANTINDFLKKSDTAPSAIGIGVAGQIDKNTGIINFSPNLNWHNVDLRQQLADKLNIPVSICNDVKAAALGEWLYGAGKGVDDLACIFVGTGIGGAIIAAILTVFVVAFICIFLHEYRKGCPPYFPTVVRSLLITTGSLLTAQSGAPIHIGEVAKNAFFTTLTLGLAGIFLDALKNVEVLYI